MEPEPAGWAIWLDISITRRKIYHSVTDPAGTVAFRSRFLTECMAYLDAEDVHLYELIPSPNRGLGGALDPHEVRNSAKWQK